MKFFFSSLLLCCLLSFYAKSVPAQTAWLIVGEKDSLARIQDHKLYLGKNPKPSFYIKANMIFSGDKDLRDSLVYLLHAEDIFSAKNGRLLSADERHCYLQIKKGKLSIPFQDAEIPYARIQENENSYSFYRWEEKSAIARLTVKLSQAEVIAAFSILDLQTGLRDTALAKSSAVSTPDQTNIARMYPENPGHWQFAWEWDGQFLYPSLSGDIHQRWTFDGEIIKPYFMGNLQEEYQWDGRILKPSFRNKLELEWKLENGIIEKSWKQSGDASYKIEAGRLIAEDVWKHSGWQIEGDFPTALIVFIVSGMANR